MGGLVSSNKSSGSEDRQRIRSHEEEIGKNDEAGEAILDGDPRRAVRWYHWVIYDMRFRIVYSTILALLLGLGLTLLLYLFVFTGSANQKFGSCLLNSEFRFECMINSATLRPSEKTCFENFGCYTDDDALAFTCHHSFPPAYQYEVKQNQNTPSEIPDSGLSDVTLTLQPRHPTNLLELSLSFSWKEDGHLEMELFDAAKKSSTEKVKNADSKVLTDGQAFSVSFPADSEFFYIHIQRTDTLETIFDTRMGPVIYNETSLSFSTTLPTEAFWGLKGGQRQVTHTVLNGPGSGELPFYMALEQSGQFHGVLIETVAPFIFQYIEAPAALFHFQQESSVKLHFFPGPTPQDVFGQVQKYRENLVGPEPTPKTLPPYWALGLHLCRKGYDAALTLLEVSTLAGTYGKGNQVPYDSDCIEETLRTPFARDESEFPDTGSSFFKILTQIESLGQKILLAQRIGLEYDPAATSEPPLIMESEGTPLIGLQEPPNGNISEAKEIVFPDYLNSETQPWAEAELSLGLSEGFDTRFHDLISGLVLVDNFPSTENSTMICGPYSGISSRIGLTFGDRNLVCANATHVSTTLTGDDASHLSVHNVFGQESLRTLRKAFEAWTPQKDRRIPIVGVSVWTAPANQDGYAGVQVPFTWSGLIDSLYQVVGNFVLNPVLVGTPICGSFLAKNETVRDLNTESDIVVDEENLRPEQIARENGDSLCLRWFQLGLLLPFARNTRGLNGTLGPLDLSLKYRNYLISSVQNRYRFNPYYYTQLYEGQLTPSPLIRPLIYDFHSDVDVNSTKGVMTQFMIGNAMMAAPILSDAPSRDVYFPSGIWYDVHGNLVSDSTTGRTFTVPSILAEVPLYIRGGHIVPILNKPEEGTAEKTRSGKYTLLATFPPDTRTPSNGSLYIDDGVSIDSERFNYVAFQCTTTECTVSAPPCALIPTPEISTIIDEIKIIGFPYQSIVDSIDSGGSLPDITFSQNGDEEETGSLRIMTLNLDWCNLSEVTLRWIYV